MAVPRISVGLDSHCRQAGQLAGLTQPLLALGRDTPGCEQLWPGEAALAWGRSFRVCFLSGEEWLFTEVKKHHIIADQVTWRLLLQTRGLVLRRSRFLS